MTDDNLDDTKYFTFCFSDSTRDVHHLHKFEEGASWNEVHEFFLDFLSAVYGYDIRKLVLDEAQ